MTLITNRLLKRSSPICPQVSHNFPIYDVIGFSVGLSDTFGNDAVDLVSTNQEIYVANDLKSIEPVKNYRPVRSYKQPSTTMVCETTTHSAFTGEKAKPAKSCKPKQ